MKTHQQLKRDHQNEMDSFEGIFFAFNNRQFKEGMEKVGLDPTDTKQIYKLPGGGFILKTRSEAFANMLERHENEMKELRKNRKELVKALAYEMWNHEYCITWDMSEACEAVGVKFEDLDKDIIRRAKLLHDSEQFESALV